MSKFVGILFNCRFYYLLPQSTYTKIQELNNLPIPWQFPPVPRVVRQQWADVCWSSTNPSVVGFTPGSFQFLATCQSVSEQDTEPWAAGTSGDWLSTRILPREIDKLSIIIIIMLTKDNIPDNTAFFTLLNAHEPASQLLLGGQASCLVGSRHISPEVRCVNRWILYNIPINNFLLIPSGHLVRHNLKIILLLPTRHNANCAFVFICNLIE